MMRALQERRVLPPKFLTLSHTVWELSNSESQPLNTTEDAIKQEAFIGVAAMTVLQRWVRDNVP
jgi:hypothetical protein